MTWKCRGIRGATTADDNTKEAVISATKELFTKLIELNDVDQDEVAAVILTTTKDLDAAFPALAARQMGWNNAALLCGNEMNVPGSLKSCIRILIFVNTEKGPSDIHFVYIKGAKNLRTEDIN